MTVTYRDPSQKHSNPQDISGLARIFKPATRTLQPTLRKTCQKSINNRTHGRAGRSRMETGRAPRKPLRRPGLPANARSMGGLRPAIFQRPRHGKESPRHGGNSLKDRKT